MTTAANKKARDEAWQRWKGLLAKIYRGPAVKQGKLRSAAARSGRIDCFVTGRALRGPLPLDYL